MTFTQLPLTAEPETVAVVFKDGREFDRCFTWETGQVMANAGFEVIAVNPDGYMTIEEAQELYDYERRIASDCFGPGEREDY